LIIKRGLLFKNSSVKKDKVKLKNNMIAKYENFSILKCNLSHDEQLILFHVLNKRDLI
jgi:hypothetical protein